MVYVMQFTSLRWARQQTRLGAEGLLGKACQNLPASFHCVKDTLK
jgi:hypothetical protein